ncbi:hypothetical protein ACFOYU_11705 [Microvirga sp. GCM10011540]|uniref:hypothetical protein n=1 Tax=Microvirga sp. GCM10011540 TaxID=3317338 RepID=UPI00361C7F37
MALDKEDFALPEQGGLVLGSSADEVHADPDGDHSGSGKASTPKPPWEGNGQPVGRRDVPLVDGAIARVYLRREISVSQLRQMREHLDSRAQGQFAFGSVLKWTVIELDREEDLLSIREYFPRLIDGWRVLP